MAPHQAKRHLQWMAQAARQASRLLIRRYGQLKKGHIASKSLNDFVTVVDHRSQALIVRILRKACPSYGVMAEEGGLFRKKQRMWIIDPLDGTSNYIRQFPLFCVSIALMEEGDPLLGLILDPIHGEEFTAIRGRGAFLNGHPIRVSRTGPLRNAFVATGFPFRMRRYFESYHRSLRRIFYRTAGIRRGGSAALDLCYTACGRFDGFWEYGLSCWDVAAGSLLVEEAGGRVTDFKGKKGYLWGGNIVAGNPGVQQALVSILKRIRGFGIKNQHPRHRY